VAITHDISPKESQLSSTVKRNALGIFRAFDYFIMNVVCAVEYIL